MGRKKYTQYSSHWKLIKCARHIKKKRKKKWECESAPNHMAKLFGSKQLDEKQVIDFWPCIQIQCGPFSFSHISTTMLLVSLITQFDYSCICFSDDQRSFRSGAINVFEQQQPTESNNQKKRWISLWLKYLSLKYWSF